MTQIKAAGVWIGDERSMKSLLTLLALGLALVTVGCQKPVASLPAPRTYEVKGIVRSLNFAEHQVIIQHEDVPGFMPSMTMPFAYRSLQEVEALSVGDAISFRLAVDDRNSWIEGVRKVDAATVNLPKDSMPVAPTVKVERLKEGDALPDFALTDDRSQPITRATFARKPLLLTFIFTRCPVPNFCPLMSRNFAEIRKELAEHDPADAATAQFLSISFDPTFDTPERLAEYASHIATDRGGWHFACGVPEEIARLTKAFSVYVQPESGTIVHGLCTALVAGDGTITRIWRGNSWEPSEVVAAIRTLTPNPNLAGNGK